MQSVYGCVFSQKRENEDSSLPLKAFQNKFSAQLSETSFFALLRHPTLSLSPPKAIHKWMMSSTEQELLIHIGGKEREWRTRIKFKLKIYTHKKKNFSREKVSLWKGNNIYNCEERRKLNKLKQKKAATAEKKLISLGIPRDCIGGWDFFIFMSSQLGRQLK